MTSAFSFSIFHTSINCQKVFIYNQETKSLEKSRESVYFPPSGNLEIKHFSIETIGDFAKLLEKQSPRSVLMAAISNTRASKVISQKQLTEKFKNQLPANTTCRSKTSFEFPDGGAILRLDYDAETKYQPLYSLDSLYGMLETSIPKLNRCVSVSIPSASSCIYEGTREILGEKNQSIYFFVSNGKDIPEIGNRINELLLANGFGGYKLSADGKQLSANIFDGSVWSTDRIDFTISGADLPSGFTQKRKAKIRNPDGGFLSLKDLPLFTDELKVKKQNHLKSFRELLKADAKNLREHFVQARSIDNETLAEITEHKILRDDFALVVKKLDELNAEEVTVAQILADRKSFHLAECFDPIDGMDPSNQNYYGRLCAKLYLDNATILHTLAHGGADYTLKTSTPASVKEFFASSDLTCVPKTQGKDTHYLRKFVHLDNLSKFYFTDNGAMFSLSHVEKFKFGGYTLKDWRAIAGVTVYDTMWNPAEGPGVFEYNHKQWWNLATSEELPSVYDADASKVLNHHCIDTFGEEAGKCLIEWMAFVVRNPGQKLQYAPLLVGNPGDGKTLIGKFLHKVMPTDWVGVAGVEGIASAFNDFSLNKRLLIIEELRQPGSNRYEIVEKLKELITNEVITVRTKNVKDKTVINFSDVIAMTNHSDALPIDETDRRWMICESRFLNDLAAFNAERKNNQTYWKPLEELLQAPEKVRGWLDSIDLSNFNPHSHAPLTIGKRNMISSATSDADLAITDMWTHNKQATSNIREHVFTTKAMRTACSSSGIAYNIKEWAKRNRWIRYVDPITMAGGSSERVWFNPAHFGKDPKPADLRTALVAVEKKPATDGAVVDIQTGKPQFKF